MERSVGIVVHRSNPEALAVAAEVILWLQARGIVVRADEANAHKLGQPLLACEADRLESVEFILTLGGDGTILQAARLAAPCGVPILGVHMGRFGYLAETHPYDLYPHLQEILDGNMRVEERLMIQADILREGVSIHNTYGLNEAVIKSAASHLLRLRTFLGGKEFATYYADGVLVATPTGSTAYALSAGGPLVAPTVEALLLVPVCPHTLSARPLVLPCSEIIEIEVDSNGGEVVFAIDAAEPFPLQDGDRVVLKRSHYVTRLIVLDHDTFYQKVRNRYLYGERLNG